jgi:hypothetical protein
MLFSDCVCVCGLDRQVPDPVICRIVGQIASSLNVDVIPVDLAAQHHGVDVCLGIGCQADRVGKVCGCCVADEHSV